MKNKIRSLRLTLPALLILLFLSQGVFAGTENNVGNENSLSPAQVVLGFVLLVSAIVLPAFKYPVRNKKIKTETGALIINKK